MRMRAGVVSSYASADVCTACGSPGETWTWRRAVLIMAQANGRGRQSRLRCAFQPWTGEDRLCRVICIENGADDPHRLGSRTGGGGATTGVHAGVVCCQGRYPRRADCGGWEGGGVCRWRLEMVSLFWPFEAGLFQLGSAGVHLMLTILDAAVNHPIPRRYSQPRPCRQTQSSPNPKTGHPPASRVLGVVVGVCSWLRKALVNRCGQNWDPERRGWSSSSPLLALGAMRRSSSPVEERRMQWRGSEGSRTTPRDGPVMSFHGKSWSTTTFFSV